MTNFPICPRLCYAATLTYPSGLHLEVISPRRATPEPTSCAPHLRGYERVLGIPRKPGVRFRYFLLSLPYLHLSPIDSKLSERKDNVLFVISLTLVLNICFLAALNKHFLIQKKAKALCNLTRRNLRQKAVEELN